MNPQDHIDEADWNEQCIRLFRNEPSTIVFRGPCRAYARLRFKTSVEVIEGPFQGCCWEQSVFPDSRFKARELRAATGLGPEVQDYQHLANSLRDRTAKVILRPYGWQSLKVQKWLPRDKAQEQQEGRER